MQRLLDDVKYIVEKYEEIARITGKNFNLFRIINFINNEVNLHSMFIAELLNPKGSHDQGDIFLQEFFKILDIDYYGDLSGAQVYSEYDIGPVTDTKGGRLDILIEYGEIGRKKAIIIENKIYAEDQENQLVRYFNYGKTKYGDGNFKLFYLNLNGTEPKEKSTKDLKNGDFKIISYENEILYWLNFCKRHVVDIALIREGINHYINLIKYLTGKTNSDVMDKEIINLIIQNRENFKAANALAQSIIDAKVKIQLDFWIKLKKALEEVGIKNIGEINKSAIRKFYEKNYSNFCGIHIEVLRKHNFVFYLGFNIDNEAFYFSFSVYDEAGKDVNEEFNKIFTEKLIYPNRNKKYNLGWETFSNTSLGIKKLEFKFKDESPEYRFIDDKEYLKKVVSSIANKTKNDIASFIEKINTLDLSKMEY